MAIEPQFDPALKELLLRHSGSHLGESLGPGEGPEIPVVIRLRRAGLGIPGLAEVAKLGNIVTARVPLGDIVRLRRRPEVASLKASTLYVGDLGRSVADIQASPGQLPVPGESLPPVSGKGVAVAVLDWGFDFAHRALRTASGRSRIRWMWDQRGGRTAASPLPYGYGREFSRRQIDEALRTPDPHGALDYDPAEIDARGEGTHGTHVLSIAAGSGPRPGVAPGADLILVHLKSDDTRRRDTLGDSVRLLEAVAWVLDKVGDRPVVFNFSLGRTGDAKDGSSPVEQALDAVVAENPGKVICMSAGNYFRARLHASGRLGPGGRRELHWLVPRMRRAPAEMEIWYPGDQRLVVELLAPDGRRVARVAAGDSLVLRDRGRVLVSLYHRLHDPNNGDNQVNLFLHPGAEGGRWQVRLGNRRGAGRFHAWIERTRSRDQSRFSVGQADPWTTIGTICSGFRTLACGAYDARFPSRPLAPFSSAGPTRDGRQVPVLVAPGVAVVAARSSTPDALGYRDLQGVTAKSGTSMASPHCAGTVALMLEAALPRLLPGEVVRRILTTTATRPSHPAPALVRRMGAGCLNARAALGHLMNRFRGRPAPFQEEFVMSRSRNPMPSPVFSLPEDSFEALPGAFVPEDIESLFDEEDFGDEPEGWELFPAYPEERPSPSSPAGWSVPPSVRTAGRRQRVRYDGAPLWTGTRRECSGRLSPGARRLRCYLLEHFPGISAIGGYACRRNTNRHSRNRLSVHGTGRALDIMIPRVRGQANSAVGDPIAAWLIRHARELGMQYLIWNRVRWSGQRRPAFAPYTGGRPHDDHIHLELNRDGASARTAWFRNHPPPYTCVHPARALPRNRRLGRRLGWLSRLDSFLPLLGFHDMTPDETTFAFALARWQLARGLKPDGILGPRTWRRLRREMAEGTAQQGAATENPAAGVQQDPWLARSMDQRVQHVMDRLVDVHGLSLNGAAGLTGNLIAESGLLPSRIEGSPPASPMRARDHCGRWRDFTPQEVMSRRPCARGADCGSCPGPRLPGIGLAQWTYPSRRAGLFRHPYRGRALGPAVLFDMDAQLDYLAWELRNRFSRLHRLLSRPGVPLRETTWRVLLDFERPAPIVRDPRSAASRRTFRRRMENARRARELYCQGHPRACGGSREMTESRWQGPPGTVSDRPAY